LNLLETVKKNAQVKDAYMVNQVPTFIIPSTPQIGEKIIRLKKSLKANYQIRLTQEDDHLILQIIPLEEDTSKKASLFNYPLILFIITIITVTISGYFTAKSYIDILQVLGRPLHVNEELHLIGLTIAYTVSILSVLGLHELGHTLACRHHHIEASMPLFLPGIPLLTPGTFGAVIRQKNPALNRNQLFDIGFSGPIIGFAIALIVSLFGYSWSISVNEAEYMLLTSRFGEGDILFLPFLFDRLSHLIFPNSNSFTHILHPVAYAGWITTLITFLNIFPIGQLDGGHISRALFGAKWHRLISYAMICVMIVAGWWPMALMVLFLLRTNHPGTFDEVTKVSLSRKVLSVFVVIIFVSCFTLSPESPLLYFLYS